MTDNPSTAEKVRAHRARLRAQGMRPVQIWISDTRAAGFRAEAKRQALIVAQSTYAEQDQAFVDAISAGLE